MTVLNGITLGQYIPADSPVHRLDPRCKTVMAFAAMAAIFACWSFPALALWAVFIPIIIHVSKLPAPAVMRSVKPILILVIFTSLMHVFFTPGREIFSLGLVTVTYEGVFTALRLSVRLMFLVICASMLMLTTSPSELSAGFESLMSPFEKIGLPAHEIAMMMTIALRFIPTLFEETDRILKAQASRGADFESGNILRRVRAYIPVLIPLFVLVFQRADTLASAMESRCYRGGAGRTRMYPLEWKKADTAAAALFTIYLLLTFAADRIAL